MAEDTPTDSGAPAPNGNGNGNGNGLQKMTRVTLMLHEGMIRGLGVMLETYKSWLRSHRSATNRPPNGNGNGNGKRRPNGNGH